MKSSFSKILFILTTIFCINANAAKPKPILFDALNAAISAKASTKLNANSYAATFELKKEEIRKDDHTKDKINNIIKSLQKAKIQYSQQNYSSFYDVNGSQSFQAVHKITIITKDYNDIKNNFTMFKKQGFKISRIETFTDAMPSKKQLRELYNKAYKKAERKAKLLASKLDSEYIIKRSYAQRDFSKSNNAVTTFDTSAKVQAVDFDKQKPRTEKLKATVEVFMQVEILPKLDKKLDKKRKHKHK